MPLIVTNSAPTATTSPLRAAGGLRDIQPPVVIPSGWEWLWWTLGTLVVVVLGICAWLWWQRRRQELLSVPPVPAHVRARRKLEEALALIGQPKQFCIAVSDALRGYLEERFTFHAPERTTEEFLHELQATTLLTPEQKTGLGDFLTRCDLVKFAKYEPGEPELRDLHGSALRLVDETDPRELETPPSSPNTSHNLPPGDAIGESRLADGRAVMMDVKTDSANRSS